MKERPGDGLRATCPLFKSRLSHMGNHFIMCDASVLYANVSYLNREARDAYYAEYCCNGGDQCELRNDSDFEGGDLS